MKPTAEVSPVVSVILPCFQAEAFVEEAVRSLLDQTFPDLEVIALDDGSTDRTGSILAAMAASDRRLRVLSNGGNLGLVPTLNRGIHEARGTYLARMDADDLARPDRVERQLRVLAGRSDVDLIGGAIELMDRSGRTVGFRPVRFLEPETAGFVARFATPLAHATVLGRTAAFRAHPYRSSPETLHCEDYDLWTRMLRAGLGLGNVEDALVRVRVHPSSVSRAFEDLQIEHFVAIAKENLRALGGPSLSDGVLRVLVNRTGPATSPEDLREGIGALEALEREALGEATSDRVRTEIARFAAEHRLDILLQSALRGSPGAKTSALLRLGLGLPRFALGAARPYLVRKLRAGREARLVPRSVGD